MYIMENLTYPQRKRTPSFSSSLLDSIYHSIDESKPNLDKKTNTTTTTLKHINLSLNHNNNNGENFVAEKRFNRKERMNNLRRHSMILDGDYWIQKQSTHINSQFMNSSSSVTSSSSESIFSSSETEYTTQNHKTRSRSSKHEKRDVLDNNHHQDHHHQHQKKPKHERGTSTTTSFARTKLRALKIYGELNQKVKHPVSPGSRIASFLSSIFSSGNVKKAKMCYAGAVEDVTFEHKSKSPCFSNPSTTSSSSSSLSRRSCMSKTPKNNNNGVKRSVRFYPFSVILGEDSHQLPSCHRFSNYENDPSLLPLSSVRKVSRRSNSIEEFKKNCFMAKENNIGIGVMKGFHNNNSHKGNDEFCFRSFYDNDYDDEDDEDCDALSYSSSDLFELDHIIGAARYQEELPVYETTNVETNLAIANGLCL